MHLFCCFTLFSLFVPFWSLYVWLSNSCICFRNKSLKSFQIQEYILFDKVIEWDLFLIMKILSICTFNFNDMITSTFSMTKTMKNIGSLWKEPFRYKGFGFEKFIYKVQFLDTYFPVLIIVLKWYIYSYNFQVKMVYFKGAKQFEKKNMYLFDQEILFFIKPN